MIEETATRMVSPASFSTTPSPKALLSPPTLSHWTTPQAQYLVLQRCYSNKRRLRRRCVVQYNCLIIQTYFLYFRSNDVPGMYLVPNPTSNVKRQVFESGIEPSPATARWPLSNCPITPPSHGILLHDRDMGEFVSAFSQKTMKTTQEVAASTFCLSDRRLPRPTVLSLEAGGSQLRCHFPAEAIHSLIQVEKRVMNEGRSHLPSLGLLHTMHRKFNVQRTFYSLRHHVKSVRGKGITCCTIFFRSRSVDSPRPESPLCSQLEGRYDTI